MTTSNRRLRSLLLPPSSSHSSSSSRRRTSSRCSSRNSSHRCPFPPLHPPSLSRCRPLLLLLRGHFNPPPPPWACVLRPRKVPRLSAAEQQLGPHHRNNQQQRQDPPSPPPQPTFPTSLTSSVVALLHHLLLPPPPPPPPPRTERRLKSRAWRRLRRKSDRISCLLRPSRLRRVWATLATPVQMGGIASSRRHDHLRARDLAGLSLVSRPCLCALFSPLLPSPSSSEGPRRSSPLFCLAVCSSAERCIFLTTF